MRRLVLVVAVRRDEHRGHHRERAERGRDHVTHHVAIIVFARPDHTALAADDARDGVVDEGVEIFDARRGELGRILLCEDLGEDVFEAVVVCLGDGVLRREPKILLAVERIVEAAACKALDAGVGVVHAHHHSARLGEVEDLEHALGVLAADDEARLLSSADVRLDILVDVAVGVPRDRDRLLPSRDVGHDALDHDRSAEDGAVKYRPDRAVGALPHLCEVVLGHTLCVGGDRRALDADPEALDRHRRLVSDLVAARLARRQTEIVILRFEIDERFEQNVLDHRPNDARHLVAVHLDQRRVHTDLFHLFLLGHCPKIVIASRP